MLKTILANISHAVSLSKRSESVRVAAVVSGSGVDRDNWERYFAFRARSVFNADGSTAFFSLQEKIGDKTREGNMLGTLLAYGAIKKECASRGINYRDHVALIGMLFGRGERMSPVTQAKGNRKSAVNVAPGSGNDPGAASVEEALRYFTPVAKHIESRGFRGVLDKWGDETEIASVDLKGPPSSQESMSKYDVIKFVSVVEITEELALEKEWVIFDDEGNMIRQLPRGPLSSLDRSFVAPTSSEPLSGAGDRHACPPRVTQGVSLGPVALSYDLLDIALEIFADDIKKPGVAFDVDPYFLMALVMPEDPKEWAAAMASDPALEAFAGAGGMMPDFFDKVLALKAAFKKKHGRELNIKVFDMGSGVYWGDIGQHASMRRKFMALNDKGCEGKVARHIAGIPEARDGKGNIVVNSVISPEADVRDSVVVNSKINGCSVIRGSVIIDSEFSCLKADEAFSVRSVRLGRTVLAKKSGLFESLGSEDLTLSDKERHVSVLAAAAKYDLKVSEDTDLRDKKLTLEVPVFDNAISFNEAYRAMEGVSMEELERRREKVIEAIKNPKPGTAAKALKFGTSGLRDTVENLTDREVYINTAGFVKFLKEKNEAAFASFVAVGGDLRPSTPGIMAAVVKAIEDEGCKADIVGAVPSPVLANYGLIKGMPSIMVTGSHIPADRNGIKFTKRSGEVLKDDEPGILKNVAVAREAEEGAKKRGDSIFDDNGAFKKPFALGAAGSKAAAQEAYVKRYTDVFPKDALKGRKIVVYQHSAVGRDILADVLKKIGAEVITVGRSDKFLPVDTEKVSAETMEVLASSAREYKPDAVVSMDGDSDRPLVADETGKFIPGDKLGALVSIYLKPDFAAVPVSANPAVVKALTASGIEVKQTRIGSPFVIAAMNAKLAASGSAKVVSWESNGGFLTGSDWVINGNKLKALPTRDAILPIIAVSVLAKEKGETLSGIVKSELPAFYTASGVVDNKDKGAEAYTSDMGAKLVSMFSPSDPKIEEASYSGGKLSSVLGSKLTSEVEKELAAVKSRLERYFGKDKGFGELVRINFVDGIRMTFMTASGKEEISHIRPSGNAPEFRNYAAADTQERANEIAELRYRIVPEMVRDLA